MILFLFIFDKENIFKMKGSAKRDERIKRKGN